MENNGSLEKLKGRLYKKGESFSEREGRPGIYEVKTDYAAPYWKSEPPKTKMKISFFMVLLVCVLALMTGVSIYFFLYAGGSVSSKNISIDVRGPVFVDGGVLSDFDILIKNNNSAALETADLIIEFPNGSFSDEGAQLARERFSLDMIEANSEKEKNISATFFGTENEIKELNFILEYRLADSNAIFEKKQNYSFKISKAPLGVSISVPGEASSRQETEIKVQLISNSESIVKALSLKMEYPAGFQFLEARPAPSEGDNVWFLGDMGRSQKKEITIVGVIEGQDLEEKAFNVFAGVIGEDGSMNIYAKTAETIVIKKPSLNLSVFVDGRDAEKNVVSPGDSVRIELQWSNNLPVVIRNASIELSFEGSAHDEGSISVSGGFYRAFDKKITWNSSSFASLASINPGQKGKTQFGFYVKNPLPVYTSADKNFSINLLAKISGEGTYDEFENREISDFVSKEIKIASPLQLAARALYYSGPFSNSGPMPPRPGAETTYTISLSLGNNCNDFSGAEVDVFLPPYVRWLDTVSPGADIKFDEKNGVLVWNIGDVPAGTGIVSPAKEAAFKIGLTPNLNHVNSAPVLVDNIKLEANDNFIQESFLFEAKSLDTMLTGDSKFKSVEGIVR